ncbi:hypothetical protein LINPERHAP1_LOCUS1447 [Linum perenne]
MQAQLTAQLGYTPSRGLIWLHAHKLSDGSFNPDCAEFAKMVEFYENQPDIPNQHNLGDSLDLAHQAFDATYSGEHSSRVSGNNFGYYQQVVRISTNLH